MSQHSSAPAHGDQPSCRSSRGRYALVATVALGMLGQTLAFAPPGLARSFAPQFVRAAGSRHQRSASRSLHMGLGQIAGPKKRCVHFPSLS